MAAGATAGRHVDVLLTNELARLVMDAIDYPVAVQVPSALRGGSGDDSLGDTVIEAVEVVDSVDRTSADDRAEVPEVGQEYERAILAAVEAWHNGSLGPDDVDADERRALEILSGAGTGRAALAAADPNAIGEALRLLVTPSRLAVEVQWVKIWAGRPGAFVLANPISCSG